MKDDDRPPLPHNVIPFRPRTSRPPASTSPVVVPDTPYAMGFLTGRNKAAALVRTWCDAYGVDYTLLLQIAKQIEEIEP